MYTQLPQYQLLDVSVPIVITQTPLNSTLQLAPLPYFIRATGGLSEFIIIVFVITMAMTTLILASCAEQKISKSMARRHRRRRDSVDSMDTVDMETALWDFLDDRHVRREDVEEQDTPPSYHEALMEDVNQALPEYEDAMHFDEEQELPSGSHGVL